MPINYSEGGTSNNGRIIQIARTTDNARRKYTNVSNNTWSNTYTNIDTTITPKLASSKLLIYIGLNYGIGDGNAASVFFQLREGNSTIHSSLNGSGSDIGYQCFYHRRWNDSNASQMEYYMDQATMVGGYIDAQNTSARTYKLYMRIQNSGYDFTINRDGSDYSDSAAGSHSPIGASYMTIMEVTDV